MQRARLPIDDDRDVAANCPSAIPRFYKLLRVVTICVPLRRPQFTRKLPDEDELYWLTANYREAVLALGELAELSSLDLNILSSEAVTTRALQHVTRRRFHSTWEDRIWRIHTPRDPVSAGRDVLCENCGLRKEPVRFVVPLYDFDHALA